MFLSKHYQLVPMFPASVESKLLFGGLYLQTEMQPTCVKLHFHAKCKNRTETGDYFYGSGYISLIT